VILTAYAGPTMTARVGLREDRRAAAWRSEVAPPGGTHRRLRSVTATGWRWRGSRQKRMG